MLNKNTRISLNKIPQILNCDSFDIYFSTKEDGNMIRTNENREYAHKTRMNFLNKCGVDLTYFARVRPTDSPNIEVVEMGESCIKKQVYINKAIIEADFDFYYDGSDAIFSLEHQVSVGLMSGDCIPLIVWDNKSGFHGIVHIGLLGALNRIAANLPVVLSSVNVTIDNLHFYFGPSIGADDYCLSLSGLWKAIKHQVESKIPDIYNFTSIKNDNTYFDIQAYVISQLLKIGVHRNNIQVYPYSTAGNDSIFFSHHKSLHKDGGLENGRFYSIIKPK